MLAVFSFSWQICRSNHCLFPRNRITVITFSSQCLVILLILSYIFWPQIIVSRKTCTKKEDMLFSRIRGVRAVSREGSGDVNHPGPYQNMKITSEVPNHQNLSLKRLETWTSASPNQLKEPRSLRAWKLDAWPFPCFRESHSCGMLNTLLLYLFFKTWFSCFFFHYIFFFMESMTWIRNFCQLHWLNVDTIDICRDESDICKLHFESRLGVTLLVLVCLYFATFFFLSVCLHS